MDNRIEIRNFAIYILKNPMIMDTPKNPFILGHRIRRPYFCDRIEEQKQLLSSIVNGRNTVLISPRRMGKTTLIDVTLHGDEGDSGAHLPEIALAEDYLVFFIDILSTNSLSEFTYLFGKAIYDKLASKNKLWLNNFLTALKSLKGTFGFDPFTGIPTFDVKLGDLHNPEYMLEEIFQYIENCGRQVIVVIDEFQQITKYPEKNTEALLRTYMQRTMNATFIFAGSESTLLREMFISSKRPFYNSAEIMHLNPIDEEVYVDFAWDMFSRYGRSVDADAVRWVYRLFSGNTFYLQRSMNGAFADTPSGGGCDRETVERSVRGMLAANEMIYRELLSQISVRHKPVLYAVAQERIAANPTSGAFIRKYSLASASSVQNALQKLTSSGLLTRLPEGYIVTDPLFRIFINRLYSIPEF